MVENKAVKGNINDTENGLLTVQIFFKMKTMRVKGQGLMLFLCNSFRMRNAKINKS